MSKRVKVSKALKLILGLFTLGDEVASPSDHRPGARYSPSKRCRPAMSRSVMLSARWRGSAYTPGWPARTHERKKLERLCRYVSRPAVSEKRLSLAPNGNVRYQLKTPYREGTTHVVFEPLDFIARLAALGTGQESTLPAFMGCLRPTVSTVHKYARSGTLDPTVA
jgi:hypothetical protein